MASIVNQPALADLPRPRRRIAPILERVGINHIINGGFTVAQRGVSFTSATTPANNDDTYLLDRWILLSSSNDVVDVTQETTVVPTGAYAAIRFDTENSNNRFGILQILESRDSAAFIGGVASLSFKARRTGTSMNNLRAAVLSWNGTEDVVTSDIVNAWGVQGTNPSLVTSWTFENTPANLGQLTNLFQTFRIRNISIDTNNTTNIAVFIFLDETVFTLGELLYIADVQLELGAIDTPFERRPFTLEHDLATRYYEELGGDAADEEFVTIQARSTSAANGAIMFRRKRVAPAITFSATSDFNVTDDSGATEVCSVLSGGSPSVTAFRINATKTTSDLVAGNAVRFIAANTNARIRIDAEL